MHLKDLEAIIKLCRKTGVSSISIEGVTLTLTSEAPQSGYKRRKREPKAPVDPFLQALAESKDAASRAKAKYITNKDGTQPHAEDSPKDPNEGPNELAMLLWSAGDMGGAS